MSIEHVTYCWGRNGYGQVGTGEGGADVLTPAPVTGGHRFNSIVAGRHLYTCGVTSDGVTYCWGHNDRAQLGRGFMSNGEPTLEPVLGTAVFESVHDGFFHTCAVAVGGAAYCWGHNGLGQAGNNVIGSVETAPVSVYGGLRFTQLTAGGTHSCGITERGIAYCWGSNRFGESGNGVLGQIGTPLRVRLP